MAYDYEAADRLSDEETVELIGRLWAGDKTAENKLVLGNIRLVASIVKPYENRGVDKEDLMQEGLIGLLTGLRKYDPSKQVKLSTYVYYWILSAVQRTVFERAGMIRVPVRIGQAKNIVHAVAAEIMLETGSEPTPEEISKRSKLTMEEVLEALQCDVTLVSLEETVGEKKNSEIESILNIPSDDNGRIGDDAADTLLRKKTFISKILSRLTREEQTAITEYYGLMDDTPKTFCTVGKIMGMPEQSVRNLITRAKQKLQTVQNYRGLEALNQGTGEPKITKGKSADYETVIPKSYEDLFFDKLCTE